MFFILFLGSETLYNIIFLQPERLGLVFLIMQVYLQQILLFLFYLKISSLPVLEGIFTGCRILGFQAFFLFSYCLLFFFQTLFMKILHFHLVSIIFPEYQPWDTLNHISSTKTVFVSFYRKTNWLYQLYFAKDLAEMWREFLVLYLFLST